MSEEELDTLNTRIEETMAAESIVSGAVTETEMAAKKKKNKNRKKRNRRVKTIIFLLLALICFCFGVYLFFFYNYDAYQRQATEESLADLFIQDLIEQGLEEAEGENETEEEYSYTPDYSVITPSTATETETATVDEDGIIHMGSSFDYSDDVYLERDGVTYTPDYAEGDLLFVLEFPSCGIRRGVYGGTWDEIYHDLDIWMVTIANPDMVLGETHISIYGHNHTSQNLSFNNLKAAQIGDKFYLYARSGIYVYEVTNIFSDWRSSTTTKYVNDFSISSDVCYIITCGRDNFLINGESSRYKDYIVEGHLVERKSLTEYALEVIRGETY